MRQGVDLGQRLHVLPELRLDDDEVGANVWQAQDLLQSKEVVPKDVLLQRLGLPLDSVERGQADLEEHLENLEVSKTKGFVGTVNVSVFDRL